MLGKDVGEAVVRSDPSGQGKRTARVAGRDARNAAFTKNVFEADIKEYASDIEAARKEALALIRTVEQRINALQSSIDAHGLPSPTNEAAFSKDDLSEYSRLNHWFGLAYEGTSPIVNKRVIDGRLMDLLAFIQKIKARLETVKLIGLGEKYQHDNATGQNHRWYNVRESAFGETYNQMKAYRFRKGDKSKRQYDGVPFATLRSPFVVLTTMWRSRPSRRHSTLVHEVIHILTPENEGKNSHEFGLKNLRFDVFTLYDFEKAPWIKGTGVIILPMQTREVENIHTGESFVGVLENKLDKHLCFPAVEFTYGRSDWSYTPFARKLYYTEQGEELGVYPDREVTHDTNRPNTIMVQKGKRIVISAGSQPRQLADYIEGGLPQTVWEVVLVYAPSCESRQGAFPSLLDPWFIFASSFIRVHGPIDKLDMKWAKSWERDLRDSPGILYYHIAKHKITEADR